MKLSQFVFFLLATFNLIAQQNEIPIGLWREHLPYNSAIAVSQAPDRMYCATPFSAFSVGLSDYTIQRMSRITGLSETGIAALHYDNDNEKLVIAYTSGNLDIVYREDIINVPDIKHDNISGDKSIREIHSYGSTYYLATGLGIIVVDGERYEIKDTWMIGDGGSQVSVNAFTNDADFFYAATDEGLKRAPIGSPGLADYSNWHLISGTSGLPEGPCQEIIQVQGKMVAQSGDSLYSWSGASWEFFFYNGLPVNSINASEDRILVCQQQPAGQSKVVVIDTSGAVLKNFDNPAAITKPETAVYASSRYWIADRQNGLIVFNDDGTFEKIIPDSPAGIASGEMIAGNRQVFVAAGSVDNNWHPLNDTSGIYVLNEGKWTNINKNIFPQLDSTADIITLAIDSIDQSIWGGSFGGGLLQIKANTPTKIYKHGFVNPAINAPTEFRVSGLVFDRENNLWITNYGATEPLLVKTPTNKFYRFAVPFFLPENALADLIVDDFNYKWIISPNAGGLLVYDQGNSLESAADDRWKRFTVGVGTGNLPGAAVLSIAKDRNNFIWVGTSNGVGVFQCTGKIFSNSGCDAIWPVVQEGSFAGYLFKGERVQSIAIDGADRKWVATNKGVWLLNPTGEKVIYQFTAENSPLPANDVKKVAIDGQTGEVFFSTTMGISSFRSTATEPGPVRGNVLVFPNPVPPGYTGTIGIKGLVENSIVKITELNGRLVFQTRALGGQAVWDGRDYRGRRISTGVYLVLVSNDERTEKTAGKIVFINK